MVQASSQEDFPGEEAEEGGFYRIVGFVEGLGLTLFDDGAQDAEDGDDEEEDDR